MNPENPYQPPRAIDHGPLPYAQNAPGPDAVPGAILEAMRQTRPWVTFLAVLGFIGTGLMVLAGLVMMVMGGFGKLPAGLGIVYVVLALLYVAPSYLLFRYGAEIKGLLEGGGMQRLVQALVSQKSFWKFMGIMTLIVMGIYFLVLVGAMVAGFMGALR
jgi:hypothetical protein